MLTIIGKPFNKHFLTHSLILADSELFGVKVEVETRDLRYMKYNCSDTNHCSIIF